MGIMIKIPQLAKWFQSNRGDIFGSIWSSFNIDLTHQRDRQKGNIRINRMLRGATSASLTNLGIPVAFATLGNAVFAVAGVAGGASGRLFTQGLAHTSLWTEVANTPTNFGNRYSDMVVFASAPSGALVSKLWISEGVDDDVRSYDGSAWGDGTEGVNLAGGASKPHMMCVYANRLYCSGAVSNDSVIYSMSNTEVVATSGTNTVVIRDEPANVITFLRPVSNGIWIGTVNTRGGEGHIYFWNGEQTSINASYRLQSAGVLAGIIKDDVLYCVDVDGRLLVFNGGTFVEIDRFPLRENYLTFSLGKYNERWIHPNGMTVVDDRILILIENAYDTGTLENTIQENVPSGIWEWSKDTGLYHKFSLSNTPLSGSGTGTIVDYGQTRIGVPGACAFIKQDENPTNDNGSLYAGARIYTTATALIYGIFIDDLNDTGQKYGYFVTPKIYSQTLQDAWQKVYVRHRKLLNSTDKIIVKYRVDEDSPSEATITWVDTDTFTSTDTDFANYEVGDEIEVIQGDGSGKCAHISSISEAGGTYTVNLDDTFAGVTTNTAIVRMQRWKKCGEGTDQTVKFHQFPIGANDTWVQIKVCMQFTGENEVDDLLLINDTYQKAA